MYRIIVCDDETDIRNAIDIYLKTQGYETVLCGNGQEVLDAMDDSVSLVLLDVMMPVMDGITAMRALREKSNVPVILLTAKSEDTDKILGLENGADDYITKPFNPMELLARVRSQLRRYTMLGGAVPIREPDAEILRCGDIVMNDTEKSVTICGDPVPLTPTEYDILKLFLEAPNRVFSGREIYEKVWKESPIGSENTVAVHIRHLREKIEIDPANPRWLTVVWGHGYKLVSE